MENISALLSQIRHNDLKSLARAITIVENESEGYKEILFSLDPHKKIPVIGFTGPPGAGKSTLINGLIDILSKEGKKVAVIAIDPTSPFNYGSLLGDRLRMSAHFTDPNIFIRSIATRGSLGGLSEKATEIVDVMKSVSFDMIIVETVGVGQSEVEIAGLADTTVVVLVPESGDEIQTMKSGLMEIADVFVVNKSDREGADIFAGNLIKLVHAHATNEWEIPVIKTSAVTGKGISELITAIEKHTASEASGKKKNLLALEKAYRLIQRNRMRNVNRVDLQERIEKLMLDPGFNLYKFADSYSDER